MAATKKDFPQRALSGRGHGGSRARGRSGGSGARRTGTRGRAGGEGIRPHQGQDHSTGEDLPAHRSDTRGRDFPHPVEVAVEDTRVAAYERGVGRTEGRTDALNQEPSLGPERTQGDGADRGAQPQGQNSDKERAAQGQDSAVPIESALAVVGQVALAADISAHQSSARSAALG